MDTQGAWDGEMTQKQSATIFGLTALLSSKLIYNISMQIQEDKVENLGFFMSFAQVEDMKLHAPLQRCPPLSFGPLPLSTKTLHT